MRYYFFSIILLLCLIVIFPVPSFAQIGGSSEDVGLEIIPENPGANTKVVVKITSYTVDLNSSLITWIINDKVQKTAIGDKSFTFTTGDFGVKTKLRIAVKTNDGSLIDKTISIEPADVDLIWQSDSFVPAFYKGKALFSHENRITFIAIPHIINGSKEIPASNLVYTWTKNGSIVEEASGYGKDTYSFYGSLISRPLNIEVTVSSLNTNVTAYSHTTVSPINPLVIFYKKSPLYGVEFQKNISGEEEIKDPEISILSVPLFFGVNNYKSSELSYKWYINGKIVNDNSLDNVEIFRPLARTVGKSQIRVSIENSRKILQVAKNGFDLSFGNTNTQ